MRQFDSMLRQGLMDANLAQYERALQSAESGEIDFSPRYLRERMRFLAAPWSWARRRGQPGQHRRARVNWRLIAVVAALLLLSACAYAVVTGQFSQWFPRMGVNPRSPETSEEVLTRTGTVIEQSQTVGNTTVTLHAAIWDGDYVWLSIEIESPDLPDEVQRHTPLHTGDCRLILREDQWEEYTRNSVIEHYAGEGTDPSPEQLEADVQAKLEEGPRDVLWLFWPEEREGNTLVFQTQSFLSSNWFTETKRPELTLHLENLATYADGKGESIIDENGYAHNPGPGTIFIEGPFDLTFTLEEPILPIRYEGGDVEVTITDIPLRFTGFELSTLELSTTYEAVNPEDLPEPGPNLSPEENDRRFQATTAVSRAVEDSVQGLWTEDGKYVDLSNSESSGSGGYASRRYPYPVDPAAVTVINIAGTRVELSELERLEG